MVDGQRFDKAQLNSRRGAIALNLKTGRNFLPIRSNERSIQKCSADLASLGGSAEVFCRSTFLGWICGKIPSHNKLYCWVIDRAVHKCHLSAMKTFGLP